MQALKLLTRLLLAIVVAASFESACAGNLNVARLRCEYAVNPLGIDVKQPRLCWEQQSERRGARQTAWQVLVASSPELLTPERADLWNSGKQSSDRSLHLPYEGKTLASSQQVFWKVRVWDGTDQPSRWSEVARWTMGVLEETDWQAEWIVAPWQTEALLLRKEFNVGSDLKRAVVHVCGLGHFEMTLNGQKSGDALLSPGWSKYNRTCLYETHDITALLREKENTIGLALGDGMYHTERRNRFSKFQGTFGPQRAFAQIELFYTDGTRQTVVTDNTWRVTPGPVTYTDVFGGEDYDARREQAGWDEPDFDDADWSQAVTLVRPKGKLRGHGSSAPPIAAIETMQPASIEVLGDTQSVVDFGQNTSFMPRITVTGEPGSTIRLTHAEVLHEDGTINRDTCGGNRGPAYWQYTKATAEPETWFPQFFYAGCRYLQVDKIPAQPDSKLAELSDIQGVVVHSTARPIGKFACGNELLNRIRTLVRWAQRSNMVSVLTDCPHREKLGWLEQYHLNGPGVRYEFDAARIFIKSMRDMADSQLESGLVPNIAPEYVEFPGTFRAAAEWGSAVILVPWQHYQATGDDRLLRDYYEVMQRYLAYLGSVATDHIVEEGLGDWYDLAGDDRPGFAKLTPPPVTATAFYFKDAHTMGQIAKLLGKREDAQRYANLAARIRDAWLAKFRSDDGQYATGSQCSLAIALVMELARPEDRQRLLDALVEDIQQRDNSTTAGDVGFRYVLRALAENGRADVIYDMINQDERPGYGYQLKMGATSLTEGWDANTRASHNHFMLGHITEWFYKDLVGIASDPEKPGYRNCIIKPCPVGDLAWAEGTHHSIRGPIRVRWQRTDGEFKLQVAVPAGTTATVFVPAEVAEQITESGKPADESEGVSLLGTSDGRVKLQIESGEYEFIVANR